MDDVDALAARGGEGVYSGLLRRICRVEFPTVGARAALSAVFAHRAAMSRALGREVWLPTAMADFLQDAGAVPPVLVPAELLGRCEAGAYRDSLTGLFNRRYLDQQLVREASLFYRFGLFFSILALDLDLFKQFNDAHGHLAGDVALRETAGAMQAAARQYDSAVRAGGDEFLMVLPRADAGDAAVVAGRIQEAVRGREIAGNGGRFPLPTLSVGIATFPLHAMDIGTLLHRADEALYSAKCRRGAVAVYRDAKRRHPRFRPNWPLGASIRRKGGGIVAARIQNISQGGVLCGTDAALRPAAGVELRLARPELHLSLSLPARVERLERAGDGGFLLALSFRLPSEGAVRDLFSLIACEVPTRAVGEGRPACGTENACDA